MTKIKILASVRKTFYLLSPATIMFIRVFLVYFITVVATVLFSIVFDGQSERAKVCKKISALIMFGNSLVNPFIYFYRSKDYRRYYKRLMNEIRDAINIKILNNLK